MDQGRALLLDPKRRIMPALLSQITHDDVIRRRGVLGAIRNCCFSESDHEYLVFSPDIDIITQVLKQLVGPEPLDERVRVRLLHVCCYRASLLTSHLLV